MLKQLMLIKFNSMFLIIISLNFTSQEVQDINLFLKSMPYALPSSIDQN